jgi:hypothetical protein
MLCYWENRQARCHRTRARYRRSPPYHQSPRHPCRNYERQQPEYALGNYNPDEAEVLASAGVVHKINGVIGQRTGVAGLNAALPFVRVCLQRAQPVFYLSCIAMPHALQLCCTYHA